MLEVAVRFRIPLEGMPLPSSIPSPQPARRKGNGSNNGKLLHYPDLSKQVVTLPRQLLQLPELSAKAKLPRFPAAEIADAT
jgi:hypothetical protein